MKRVTVGEIAEITCGGTPPRGNPEYWNGHIPWVKTGEIRFNRINNTEEKITKAAIGASAAKVLPPGTLLMAMYGQGKTRGQVAILDVEAATNQACAAIRPFESGDTDYLFQYLAFQYSNIRLLSNAGSQENLNADLIRGIPVVYPRKEERLRIGEILTTWDEALEKLDLLLDAKERRKKAMMQQLLSGAELYSRRRKLRMSSVLERVFRPVHWSPEMALSLVSLRRRCGGLFRRPEMLASEYKTQDLHELRTDDFLISKRQVAHGAWALVPKEFNGSHVSKEYAILVNSAPTKLHMPYFAWLAQTPRMIRFARVSSTGVHIEKLIFDPDVFLREYISLPEKQEQERIAQIFDAAEKELNLLRAQRAAIDQQKRGLMQRLLTGKLRVKV